MGKNKKYYIVIVFVISSSLFFRERIVDFFRSGEKEKISIVNIPKEAPAAPEQPKVEIAGNNEEEKPAESAPEEKLPDKILLEAPFLSQAPMQIWDALHEDACEEASLIMVKYSLEGKKAITPKEGDEEIKKLVAYQEKNGYGTSVTLQELGRIAKNFYNLQNYRAEENVTVEGIKKELAKGNLVIVGAAGKVLDNPNFKNGGPNYHMLVIRGYDEKGFITNDPGTRKGEGFRYTFDNLFTSIHNWDPKDILNGKKDYLVIEK